MTTGIAPDPVHGFRFTVEFRGAGGAVTLCHGAFSEVTGLEATMEPFAITEGGRSWGQWQRVGRTTFSTVILRRGLTTEGHPWQWFDHVGRAGQTASRMEVTIRVLSAPPAPGTEPQVVAGWVLHNALPVKVKLPELNAGSEALAIEELHLVHEGISAVSSSSPDTTPVRDSSVTRPPGDTRLA